jgi:hypothetical protein
MKISLKIFSRIRGPNELEFYRNVAGMVLYQICLSGADSPNFVIFKDF